MSNPGYFGYLAGHNFNVYSAESCAEVLGRYAEEPVEGPIRDKRGQIVADLIEAVLYVDPQARIRSAQPSGEFAAVEGHAVNIATKQSTAKLDLIYEQVVAINNSYEKVS